MNLKIDEELFKDLWPYIIDDNVTDIKWNGSNLWINDLKQGRYLVKGLKLDETWLKIFTNRIANAVNVNFNYSNPSLKAETKELRIQAQHPSVSSDNSIALAIRKTPCVSRLANQDLVKASYLDVLTSHLLPCLMRSRLSGVIIGDVGSGKTELEKYLVGFIPEVDGIVSVEDTLELHLKDLYPNKDIYEMRISDNFKSEDAIKDALRLMTKWLILSEARGEEIKEVMEAASTGCVALTSIHAENVWEIPDRILNMAKEDVHHGFENDVYTFFDYAIKVKAEITNQGIKRSIDQICFFDRTNKTNNITLYMVDGELLGNHIPKRILYKFSQNNEQEFLSKYRVVMQAVEARQEE